MRTPPPLKMCKCLSGKLSKVNTMGWKTPAILSSSRAFLEFLIEQEIHYPSVSRRSDHECNCLLTMLTGAFVWLLIQSSQSVAAKQPIVSALPSSGINIQAGATVEQSARCGGRVWGGDRAEQTHELDHTTEMTDNNKQTYQKVSQTAVTMFVHGQFTRKREGEEHQHYLVPPTLPTHLGNGERGSGRGGRVLV